MESQLSVAVMVGIFTLIGALIGTGGSLVKDWLNNRAQLRLEKVRLHERDTIEAYKRLFVFSGKLSRRVFPLAEDKASKFQATMRENYFGELEYAYVYFTERIADILEEFEDQYVCMTRPELIPETETEREGFLEKRLFEMAQELRKEVRGELRSRT